MPSSSRTNSSFPDSAEGYVLGIGEQESDRLGLQHRLWSASAHSLWERAGIQPGMTVLDVGSGPGHASMDLAEIVGPTGRVIAVEESPLFLKHLHDRAQGRHLTNIERVLGDAQQMEPLLGSAVGTVDLAYARWVLCFVADPEAVIRGIAGLLKPGGRLAVQDYFNYESISLAPRRDPFTRVIQAIAQSWRDRGGDPDIVSRLPAMLRTHGLDVTEIRINERVARPGSTIWNWPDTFWKSYLPRLAQMGYLDEGEINAFEAAWSDASIDPDSFLMLPPVYDVIAIKRGV